MNIWPILIFISEEYSRKERFTGLGTTELSVFTQQYINCWEFIASITHRKDTIQAVPVQHSSKTSKCNLSSTLKGHYKERKVLITSLFFQYCSQLVFTVIMVSSFFFFFSQCGFFHTRNGTTSLTYLCYRIAIRGHGFQSLLFDLR